MPPHEPRGIFASEMLLFCAVVDLLKQDHDLRIIESGRARGYSTEVMARFFPNTDITSIDHKNDDDAKYAARKLLAYKNVNLVQGDGRNHLLDAIGEDPCAVLIDGPKGENAITLAQFLLERDDVLAVAMHDFYRPHPHRKLVEELFPNAFFSDEEDFVREYRHLDNGCWPHTVNNPYERKGKKIESYASTLAVILNENVEV